MFFVRLESGLLENDRIYGDLELCYFVIGGYGRRECVLRRENSLGIGSFGGGKGKIFDCYVVGVGLGSR